MIQIQSAGRRFFKKFGFAFTWAALIGIAVGGIAYYRVPRRDGDDAPWHARLRYQLERVELALYDWRVRGLGQAATRTEAIVPVAIDDESVASARVDASLALAVRPWPRELLGGMAEQAIREGAALVLLDFRLEDRSPRSCPPCGRAAERQLSDDELLGQALGRHAQKTMLTYRWSAERARRPEQELRPFLLLVQEGASTTELRPALRRALSLRAPAYLIPSAAGDGLGLWVGAQSEAKARELAEELAVRPPLTVRQRAAAEQRYEVSGQHLLVSLAEVRVEGLDPTEVLTVRSVAPPAPVFLGDESRLGAVSLSPDPDARVRGVQHLVRLVEEDGRSRILASAALEAAMRVARTRVLAYREGRLFVGSAFSVPMEPGGYSLLRWDAAEAGRGARGSLKREVSAWKLVVNLFDHEAKRGVFHHHNELEDRVVWLTDVSTPGPRPEQTPIGPMPSSLVNAQALANLLKSQGIERSSPAFDLVLTLALAFLGALLAVALSTLVRARGAIFNLVCLALVLGLHAYLNRYLFVRDGKWIALAAPSLSLSLTFLTAMGYARTLEQGIRDFLVSTLGRYLRPDVARRIESNLSLMRPERRPVTVFFSDLDGFTSVADRLEPRMVVRLLHDYLDAMTEVVHLGGGQVDKYIGDSVMAFWGAPVRLEAHAEAACACALEMRTALEARRDDWEAKYGVRLEFRAGLNSGSVVVGDMGSEHKSNYTVMGEAVATAARLEGMNRAYGTFLLVGPETERLCRQAFAFREVDRVSFGRLSEVAPIYELVGRLEALPERKRQLLADFREALAAYRQRQFGEAKAKFERCGREHGDLLSIRYAEACGRLESHPPDEAWPGSLGEG